MPQRHLRYLLLAVAYTSILGAAENRVVDPVDAARRAVIRGNRHPLASAATDRGAADPARVLEDVTLLLRPSPALEPFLAELQDPRSPNYHKWLTPEQFADRFGLSQADIDQVTAWLRAEGLRVDEVARGRHWVRFSGAVDSVGRALGTRIRRYRVAGEDHIANADDPSVPAALANVVAAVRGLDDFLPSPSSKARPYYTSGGLHALAPADFATIYNARPLYDAGVDGTGIGIAVVGQSTIDVSDLQAFRRRWGLPAKDPAQVLVGTNPGRTSSIIEAALDLEWAGAVAPNADLTYVYARSAFTALQGVIDQNIAPIVSASFSACEFGRGVADRYTIQQASAQGITVIVSAGDEGAARCDYGLVATPQTAKGATVAFPASIPEVTAIGGTEFMDQAAGFWAARNDASGASALSYIPETIWNEYDDTGDLHAIASGGASANFPKPYWQTGPGVPDDKARDVPDVSLSAGGHVPYLVTYTGVTYLVSGTSAGAPSFAGVVALLNDYLKRNGSIARPGLGNINPMLYRLAQSAPGAFHDVVAGDNRIPCVQGSIACVDGKVGYAAAPGYDLASGLGSVNIHALVTQWTTGTASTTTVTASVASGDVSTPVTLTATVSGGGAKPTGSVTFLGAGNSGFGAATLDANGTASVKSTVGAVASAGKVTAMYNGDGVYGPSTGSTTVELKLPASGSLVVATVSPNPVPQSGTSWPYTITLTEKAGVATRLTGFTVDGVNNNGNIISFTSNGVSTNGNIAAKGSITTTLSGRNLTPPQERVFVFTGQDADGATWTQQVTVPFIGPQGLQLAPAMSLTLTPATAQQNQSADPSCQWAHELVLEEHGGFMVLLSGLEIGGAAANGQLQPLFGTTRLAPYGTLRATVCWDKNTVAPASKTYTVTGTAEDASTVTSTARGSIAVGASVPAALTLGPQSLRLAASDNQHDVTAAIDVAFTGAAQKWTASVMPANSTTRWLQITPFSGTGNGQIAVRASTAGLSNGIYRAWIAFEAPGATPDHFTVPVTLVVGASDSKIAAVANAASFKQAFAPGMLMSVFVEGLSGAAAQAARQPLPYSVAGISATVNGISAPIVGVYPAAGQVNLQVPYEAGAGPAVLAIHNGGKVSDYAFSLAVSAPGLFGLWDTTGKPAASAKPGQTLIAYITGEGDVTPFLPTGGTAAPTTALSRLPKARQPLSITVGGIDAEVLFNGIPSGIIGVTQINFTVPANAAVGPQPVVVTVGGAQSQPVNLTIAPQ